MVGWAGLIPELGEVTPAEKSSQRWTSLRNRRKRVAEEYDIPATYTDVEEMLAKEDLDIVSITTWQGPRAEATVAAAKAGVKGIIGEKPMAASLGQAGRYA